MWLDTMVVQVYAEQDECEAGQCWSPLGTSGGHLNVLCVYSNLVAVGDFLL